MIFPRKTLCFWKGGKRITLQGVAAQEVDVIEGRTLIKILKVKGMAYMLQEIEVEGEEENEPYLIILVAYWVNFQRCFESPQGLPPTRKYDHRIPLINPHQSVN